MHKHHIFICFGAARYQVSSCNMGQNLRRMNGVIELTRKRTPATRHDPAPALEGGNTQNFSGHIPAAVSEGVLKISLGHTPKLRGKWCPDFSGRGGAKFSGHTPAAVSEGVMAKNRDTPRNCGKNGVLICLVGEGGGAWDLFCEGSQGSPELN